MHHDQPLVCLIDYDNVRYTRNEHSSADVAQNLEDIAEQIVHHVSRETSAKEIYLRLYGGWTDRSGRYTRQAEWILAASQQVRGLRKQIRLLPEVVVSVAAASNHRLRGLFRRNSGVPEQKMVDTVMCCDAIYFSRRMTVVVVSDDDDMMIGGLAAAAESTTGIHLLRRRTLGAALNDDICLLAGVKIFQLL